MMYPGGFIPVEALLLTCRFLTLSCTLGDDSRAQRRRSRLPLSPQQIQKPIRIYWILCGCPRQPGFRRLLSFLVGNPRQSNGLLRTVTKTIRKRTVKKDTRNGWNDDSRLRKQSHRYHKLVCVHQLLN